MKLSPAVAPSAAPFSLLSSRSAILPFRMSCLIRSSSPGEKDADIPDEDTSLVVFNKGNILPSTKILTFYRKQPFDLEAKYSKPEELPGKIPSFIGRFSVKELRLPMARMSS